MEWLLTKEGTGNALALIVGGAVEALDAIPGKFDLTLNERKGFCKIALKHGACLVPTLAFGENSVYDQKDRSDGTFIKRIQREITKYAGFSPPVFHGRGIFQYSFGLLPYRRPLTTVVGRPIDVTKVDQPTDEQVSDLHSTYVKNLRELYEEVKGQYGHNDVELLIK